MIGAPPAGRGPWEDGSLDGELREFLCSLWGKSGLTDRSIHCARYSLRDYVGWLRRRNATWRDAYASVLRQYFRSAAEALAFPTLVLRRWTLRRLYLWAGRQGLACVNPDDCALFMRAPARSPRLVPSPRAVERLLAQPDPTTALGLRDRAILETLYATGLRASELVGLAMHQVDWRQRTMQLVGKGGVERIVVFGMPACEALGNYLRGARSAVLNAAGFGVGRTDRLFVHPGREPGLRYDQLRRLVRRHADAADLPLATPHTLSHAFATHLYQNGAALDVIQLLLGHRNLQTTTIHVTPDKRAMRVLLERHHPRGAGYQPLEWQRSGDTHAAEWPDNAGKRPV